jgi:hypothetical protein
LVEVVVSSGPLDGAKTLKVYENAGEIKWEVSLDALGSPVLADIDADGTVEIIVGKSVFNNTGNLLWKAQGGGLSPVVTDLNRDGTPEIIMGEGVYDNSGNLLWSYDGIFTAIGNFDNDEYPEIAISHYGNASISVINHDGTVLWGAKTIPGGGGGPLTIADVDGDGEPEIGIAGASYYVVYETNGDIKWQSATQDLSSAFTGSSVFDFENDGKAEILYSDELNFRIYDGETGAVRYQINNPSGTLSEYPLVVDLDNDNAAEVVLVSNNYQYSGTKGVRVFEGINDDWAPTRSLWNQHAYHITNINDDGSIPQFEKESWLTHNTYRLNTFLDREPEDLSDLRAGHIAYSDQTSILSVEIKNRGLAPTTQGSELKVYSGNPTDGGTLLATQPLQPLTADESLTVSFNDIQANQITDNVWAVIQTPETLAECVTENNSSVALLMRVKAQDIEGLSDTQTLLINVDDVNEAPKVSAESQQLSVVAGDELSIVINATDGDIGDALSYELLNAPDGVTIDLLTGEVTGSSTVIGDYTLTVIVTDLIGEQTQIEIELSIEADNNQSPEFISAPITTVNEGVEYIYDAEAVDPDGDLLTYSAVVSPAGSNINSSNGLTGWIYDETYVQSSDIENSQCIVNDQSNITFDPVLKWHWSGSAVNSLYDQVMASPVVAQLNDDNADGEITENDIPDVIFATFRDNLYRNNSVLRAVSGLDGSELWSTPVLPTAYFSPAIADIDNDGLNEIVVGGGNITGARYLLAYENDGSLKWQVTTAGAGNPYIADLQGDGAVEIIHAGKVYDEFGNTLFSIDDDSFAIALDVDLDDDLEIFAGGRLYDHTGQVLWEAVSSTSAANAFAAFGNFDNDDYPEIAYHISGSLYLIEHDGTLKWGGIAIPDDRAGALTVADVDGDNQPEIGVATRSNYLVYEADGLLKWSMPTVDASSGRTGSSVFDFDGNGSAEILYADERRLKVFDGNNGDVKFSIPNSSGTLFEYPVIADVDNDDHAEIVLVSNNYAFTGTTGVRVFENSADNWLPTRSTWNQYAYHIDNINDDGSVPANPTKSWLTHNTFRLNTFPDKHPLGLVDLRVGDIQLNTQANTLSAVIGNRGLAPLETQIQVAFYNGNPDLGGVLLGSEAISELAAGAQSSVTLSIDASLINNDVYVRVDEGRSVEECVYDNNMGKAAYVKLAVADERGLEDTQAYLINVHNVNDAPVINSYPPGVVSEGGLYQYQISISDPDIGDAHTYSLTNQSVNMSVNRSGLIAWQTEAGDAGSYLVTVTATDLAGLSTQQLVSVDITADTNNAPVFDAQPVTSAQADIQYSYQVLASDIDGDALSYHLLSNPQSMNIEEGTGLVTWLPTSEQRGPNRVVLEVRDVRGKTAQQDFTINVSTADNDPPYFNSTHIISSGENALYQYQVIAIDPDNDALSYQLVNSPASMLINQSGVITWLPTQADIGNHNVTIQVSDGEELIQSSFVLTVTENYPPRINGSPLFIAEVNTTYQYNVIASDADDDRLTYLLTEKPPAMTINEATGQITWLTSNVDLGNHDVVIQVNDGRGAIAQQSYSLAVVENRAPRFITTPSLQVTAGQNFAYSPVAVDPESTAVSYQLQQGPSNMAMDNEGVINWLTTTSDTGIHTVSVLAHDADGVAIQQTFNIEVLALSGNNSAPLINSSPGYTVLAGNAYHYLAAANDADGDALTYSLSSKPATMTIDDVTGSINWVPQQVDLGSHIITVRVDDTQGAYALQTFNLLVTNNHPPVFTSTPIVTANSNQLYQYQVAANDPESTVTSLQLLQPPEGVAMDNQGLITWVPTDQQVGTQALAVVAVDADGITSQQIFTVSVETGIAPNTPPIIISEAITHAKIEKGYAYQLVVIEPEGQALTYTLTQPAGDMAITPEGLIQWSPTDADIGEYRVTVKVTDIDNNTVEQSFKLRVTKPGPMGRRICR